MFPNSNEIMSRYVQTRARELEDEANLAHGVTSNAHGLRRRLAVLLGIALIGLTVVMILALGWWVI
jgi:hypothetical protein